VIARYGLDARKSLGQHFLLDCSICERIARQAGALDGRSVIEIGPGPGGLTRALLCTAAASITAVEVDPRAVAAIQELALANTRLTVQLLDATRVDLTELAPAPRQVVANLPYNVGTHILIRLLHQAGCWEQWTLMFQQEVAERLVARPGDEGYGRLSVLVQWLCRVELRLHLPPGVFSPPPKVSSSVVVIRPRPEQPVPELILAMERLTAAAFGQRRKMLRSSLKAVGGSALLDEAGIVGDRRAETLEIDEFEKLAHAMAVVGRG